MKDQITEIIMIVFTGICGLIIIVTLLIGCTQASNAQDASTYVDALEYLEIYGSVSINYGDETIEIVCTDDSIQTLHKYKIMLMDILLNPEKHFSEACIEYGQLNLIEACITQDCSEPYIIFID